MHMTTLVTVRTALVTNMDRRVYTAHNDGTPRIVCVSMYEHTRTITEGGSGSEDVRQYS